MTMNYWISTILLLATALGFGFGCASDGGEITAPDLILDVSSEETYTAGQDVVLIHLRATDPQDMELEFEAFDTPERSTFTTFRNEAVFTWDPIVSDVTGTNPHRLVFAVTNEAGKTTERIVNIHVNASDGTTRFLTSSSQLHNPTSDEPLRFDVRVEHSDAPQVILSMPEDRAPEGATFEQTDDFEGLFEWRPSLQQRDQRIHHVLFEADDNEEIVEYQVTIVLQDPGAGGAPTPSPSDDSTPQTCSDDDAIAHEPLGAQRTAQPFQIEGIITDTSRDWEEALLYWTTDDPLSEAPEYDLKALELDGSEFSGELSNPLLDPGQSLEFSYYICVFAAQGGDDDVICTPDDFLYRFIAYSPDDEKCRDDGIDMTSPDLAGDISTTIWEPYRVCADTPKYHHYEVTDGETVEVAISFPAGTNPKLDFSLDDELVDFEMLPCIGLAYATIEEPGTLQVRVIDDDFPYHITGFSELEEEEEEPETPVCPGDEYEPNDTPDQATLITQDFQAFDDMAICTEDDIDIFALEMVRGDSFDALLFFNHAQGDLDMTLFSPSQTDEVVAGGYGVAQGWSTDDDESISYVADESGLHYLSVVTIDEPNEYELLVERQCRVDDEFAGNHGFLEPANIDIDAYESLKICEGQSDYYRLSNDSTTNITWIGDIYVEYGTLDTFDVAVHDEMGALIEQGERVDDRIEFFVDPEPHQSLVIEIQSSEPALYDFDLFEYID